MTQMQLPSTVIPFDAIKRSDDYGDFWTGRGLMPLFEYSRWEKFAAVIEKAKASLAIVQGQPAADLAFAQVTQLHQMGNLGKGERADYRLTRFGAYLTAMAGDDTKESVARARVYFAVRTREAEVAPAPVMPDMATAAGRLQMAEMLLAGARREIELEAAVSNRDSQLAVVAPKAAHWDTLASADGDWSVADAAKILSRDPAIKLGQGRLFTVLKDMGWIFRQPGDGRWRVYQDQITTGRMSEIPASHYHPRTGELVIDPPQVRVKAKGLAALHRKLGGASALALSP